MKCAIKPLGLFALFALPFLDGGKEMGQVCTSKLAPGQSALLGQSLRCAGTGGTVIAIAILPCLGSSNEATLGRGTRFARARRWPSGQARLATVPPRALAVSYAHDVLD